MDEPFELSPVPAKPKLPGTVVLRESVDDVVTAIASDLWLHAGNCIRAFGEFHLALSGGSTPMPLYTRLMTDPNYRDIPWKRTHLWIVDERRVPFDDERSNFKMISETIADHADIPAEHVHPIFAMADDAAEAYQASLFDVLGKREHGQERLDFVLLGMGADAHTASLFPGSPALRAELAERSIDGARLVRINAGPNVTPPDRVTMTLRLLNAARFQAVMVTGEGKRHTLARIAAVADEGSTDPKIVEEFPVLGLRPVAGELRWYLDHAACPAGS